VVLNLIGGNEPCKLHQCMSRTLRNWKNTIWFIQLVHRMNHASVLHRITVFKEQKEQNMNFTQKHNLMNIYSKSMWLLLMPFRYKFRNCATLVSFSQNKVCFLVFMSTILEKDCKEKKWCVAKISSDNFFTTDKKSRHCSCEPGYTLCVLTSAEPPRVTQWTPGVRLNPEPLIQMIW